MKAYIITEGGRNIGFGHITRCSALYEAFKEKGITPQLIVNGDSCVRGLLRGKNYRIFDWLRDKKALFKATAGSEIAIIDSYLANISIYQDLCKLVNIPVYLDDTKRLDYPPGVIVNESIFAEKIDYPQKEGMTYLLGPKYIPLRKEFWNASTKKINGEVKNIVLTFGGDDPKNMTAKVLRFLDEKYPQFTKNVIIGRGFRNKKEIEDLKNKTINLIYHPDARAMKRLMLDCDVVICAGGQTLYELARLGVPTLGICVAENQEGNLKDCQRSGFSEYAGWYNARNLFSCLGKGLVKLSSYKTRLGHSRQGMRLVDGKGAARIVNVLLDKSSIFLRKARKSDCYDLWLWRNHARARRWSFNKDKIPYAMHKAWFNRKIKDKHSYIYIAQNCRGKKVGQIRFELNNKSAYVNVNLNPDFFGKGLGSKIIREGTQLFLKEHPSVKIILAEVINSNIASKKAFQKAGYVHDKL